jgi:hypothetical protein
MTKNEVNLQSIVQFVYLIRIIFFISFLLGFFLILFFNIGLIEN